MGILINGINGPIKGKVGTVIGSSRNGIPYIKGPYKRRTRSISEKELFNRKKFAAAQHWLAPLVDFVREGFRGFSPRSQGFVAAKSWLLKNSIVTEGDNLRIDPGLVKLSYGDLPNPKDIAVHLAETGDLQFTWDPTNVGENIHDQIMMIAYDVEKGFACYNTTGQFRHTGVGLLPVHLTEVKKFHVYAAFNAADRSRQSHSVYLGEWKI